MAIPQTNTSDSKASTDINLAECLEIGGAHGESFEVTKIPSEENWTPVVSTRRKQISVSQLFTYFCNSALNSFANKQATN